MTILVDWQIEQAIETGEIEVSPYDESLVQPNSLDVRLGDELVMYSPIGETIDPYDEPSNIVMFDIKNQWELYPKWFMLGSTIETIKLPDNIVATIEGKSSLARLGISIHQTGGFIR